MAAHALASALSWFWMGALTGLGFKDKADWTVWDHIIVRTVSTIALTLTTPGRFLFFDGWMGIVVPWLANSLVWAIGLIAVCDWVLSKRRGR